VEQDDPRADATCCRSLASEVSTSLVTTADGLSIAVHRLGPTDDDGGPPPPSSERDGAGRHGGGDAGVTVLAVHATGFCGPVFLPLARELAAAGAVVVAPDLRGHGFSDPPADLDLRWEGFARDVLAAVDGLGLGQPVGVGHSCGGAALLLAEQARPGTFAALYCFEPIVFPSLSPAPPDFDSPLARTARRRRTTFPSRLAAFLNYRGKPPLDALDEAALWAYVCYGFADDPAGGIRLRCSPEVEAAAFAFGASHDAYRRLGEVRCPVTVAYGAPGGFIPADLAKDLAARLPRGRAEALEGLGHFGPLEDPRRVARHAAGCLREALVPTPPPSSANRADDDRSRA
jgi:pimeloyl-ACP methyl ester carboxylesterase